MSEKLKKSEFSNWLANNYHFQVAQKNWTGFAKVFKSEFKTEITIISFLTIAMTLALPLIRPFISGSLEYDEQKTYSQITDSIGLAVAYGLLNRTILIFKEKTTLERNRAIYLRYDKNMVLFAKLLVQIAIYVAPIVVSSTLGTIVTIYKNDGKVPTGFVENLMTYFAAVILLSVSMTVSVKWALTSIHQKKVKWTVVTLILLLTVGAFVLIGLTQPKVKDPDGKLVMLEAIVKDKYIYAFVPFVNVGVIPVLLSNRIETWLGVPFIVYAALSVLLLWRPLAKNLKYYLTT